MNRQLVNCERSLAGRGLEHTLAGRVGKIETSRLTHPGVVVLESRHYSLDQHPNLIVVLNQFSPIDGCAITQGCSCQPRYNLWFAKELWRRRLKLSFGHLHNSHRVFRGNKLWSPLLQIGFCAAQAREDQRLLTRHKVGPV